MICCQNCNVIFNTGIPQSEKLAESKKVGMMLAYT